MTAATAAAERTYSTVVSRRHEQEERKGGVSVYPQQERQKEHERRMKSERCVGSISRGFVCCGRSVVSRWWRVCVRCGVGGSGGEADGEIPV